MKSLGLQTKEFGPDSGLWEAMGSLRGIVCIQTIDYCLDFRFFRKGTCLELDFLSMALGRGLSVPVADSTYQNQKGRRRRETHAAGNDP